MKKTRHPEHIRMEQENAKITISAPLEAVIDEGDVKIYVSFSQCDVEIAQEDAAGEQISVLLSWDAFDTISAMGDKIRKMRANR